MGRERGGWGEGRGRKGREGGREGGGRRGEGGGRGREEGGGGRREGGGRNEWRRSHCQVPMSLHTLPPLFLTHLLSLPPSLPPSLLSLATLHLSSMLDCSLERFERLEVVALNTVAAVCLPAGVVPQLSPADHTLAVGCVSLVKSELLMSESFRLGALEPASLTLPPSIHPSLPPSSECSLRGVGQRSEEPLPDGSGWDGEGGREGGREGVKRRGEERRGEGGEAGEGGREGERGREGQTNKHLYTC